MAKKQTTPATKTEAAPEIVAVLTPVAQPAENDTPYRMMAGNEALFEETFNKAYDSVSYIWIRYHKMADEDTDTEEKITERWVLPMTRIFDGTKKRRYFRAECMHAQSEKDAQARIERENNINPRLRKAHKMTTDRCFRLDRIEMFSLTTRRFTDKNRHYLDLLQTYPQLRARLGLKAIWIEVADENTGELQHVQVLVAAQ